MRVCNLASTRSVAEVAGLQLTQTENRAKAARPLPSHQAHQPRTGAIATAGAGDAAAGVTTGTGTAAGGGVAGADGAMGAVRVAGEGGRRGGSGGGTSSGMFRGMNSNLTRMSFEPSET